VYVPPKGVRYPSEAASREEWETLTAAWPGPRWFEVPPRTPPKYKSHKVTDTLRRKDKTLLPLTADQEAWLASVRERPSGNAGAYAAYCAGLVQEVRT